MQERRFIASTGLAPKDTNQLFSADVWVTLLIFNFFFNLRYTEGNLFPLFLPVTPKGNIPAIKHCLFLLADWQLSHQIGWCIKLSAKAAHFLPWLYEGSKMSINGSQKYLRSLSGSRHFFSKVLKQVLNDTYLFFLALCCEICIPPKPMCIIILHSDDFMLWNFQDKHWHFKSSVLYSGGGNFSRDLKWNKTQPFKTVLMKSSYDGCNTRR